MAQKFERTVSIEIELVFSNSSKSSCHSCFAPRSLSPLSPSIKKLKRSVIKEFERLEDPRVKREPKHLLSDIVTIAILATLCGADSMVAVETYGKRKREWERDVFGVAPRHSLTRYLFDSLDSD